MSVELGREGKTAPKVSTGWIICRDTNACCHQSRIQPYIVKGSRAGFFPYLMTTMQT
jgi:hypothetical protein